MKVNEMIKELEKYPSKFEVFLSVDSEGNGYGTTKAPFEFSIKDEAVIVYPYEEGLTDEDVVPKLMEDIENGNA